jgi:hypothetical protein
MGSRAEGTNPRALGTNPRAQGTNPRKTSDHVAYVRKWAADNLPSLPEVYVISEYEVAKFSAGREPTPAEVRARVQARFGEFL